jgi:hypothetical protein
LIDIGQDLFFKKLAMDHLYHGFRGMNIHSPAILTHPQVIRKWRVSRPHPSTASQRVNRQVTRKRSDVYCFTINGGTISAKVGG